MKSIKPIIQIVIYISLLLLTVACDNKQPPDQQQVIRPVKTLTITISKDKAEREFPGVIDAAKKADLSFQVSGKLKKILVKDGEKVKKGQVIAQLDDTDYQIKFNGYRADFERAKADFKRGKKLVKEGHISRSDYDKLTSKHRIAQAQLESAQQNLNYTKLKAPFSGHIAKRYVENFEEVDSKKVITTLHEISSFLVRIDVSESVMIKVKNLGQERIQYAIFDEIKDKKFPLTFKEAAILSDEESKTFDVIFSMATPEDHTVLPGMTVRVFLSATENGQQKNKIYLPAYAVLEDNTGRFVYIAKADENTSQATIHKKIVTTGELKQQGIEILTGIKVGDHVVTAGMSKLTQGLHVRLMNDIKK